MKDPDRPSGGAAPRPPWRPRLGRAGTWLAATVGAAVIGVLVPALLAGWIGSGDGTNPTPTPRPEPQPTAVVNESRLGSAERIGHYLVEADGSAQGAANALGPPSGRERDRTSCTLSWDTEGLLMRFAHFGVSDPCVAGSFCNAQVSGRDWSTAAGLQPGMPVRRMLELHPAARRVREPGEIVRYVLDPGIEPCGADARGGLEAWTNAGRVFALRVSFQAGGD